MTNLSPRYLTHPQVAVSGCTLFEAGVITLCFEIAVIATAVILGLCFGYFFLFLLGLFVLSLSAIKQCLSWVGKQKEGKPYGFFTTKFRMKISKLGLIKLPFLQANGRLQTRRRS